jgi:predicted dehydrogenase
MKIGIIGSGRIVSSVHLPLLSCIDNVQIEFIADRNNPLSLANMYNTKSIQIDEISNLPKCDIILLAVPVGIKEKYLYELIKRNCYIFTEKPFAINLNSHENLLKLTSKITCNYMRHYYDTTRNIKNIILSKIFGKIKRISILEGGINGKTGLSKNSYQNNPELSGGFLKDSACHTFSQLDFLFDNILVKEANIIWEDGFDVETHAIFDVDNLFTIDYMGTQLKNIEPSITIVFEDYEIKFNHIIPDSIFTISSLKTKKKFTLQHESSFGSTFAQAYYLKWIDFLKKVSSSSKINGEIETSISTTRIIDNIIKKGIKK